MPLRSVYTIDVDDGAFKAFHATFEKYQRAVHKLPAVWSQISKTQSAGKNAFADMAAALMAQSELLHRARADAEGMSRATANTGRAMANLARHTKEVAGNLISATGSLLKWTGVTTIASGLVGGGSLYGLDRLAQTGTGIRLSSLALGISPAQQQASQLWGTALGIDSGGLMARIQHAQQSAEGRIALLGLGMNGANQNPAEMIYPMLQRVQAMARQHRGPFLENWMNVSHVTDLFSMPEVNRIANMSPQELQKWAQKEAQQQKSLSDLRDENVKKWQELNATLDQSWQKIKDIFITKMSTLAGDDGPISKLSKAATGVVAAFMNGPGFEKLIKDVTAALDKFAKWVGSDTFSKDVEEFVSGVGQMASVVGNFVARFSGLFGGPSEGGGTGGSSPRAEAGGPPTKGSDVVGLVGMGAGLWAGSKFGPWGAVIGTLLGAAVTGAGTDSLPLKSDGTIDRKRLLGSGQLYRDMPGLDPAYHGSPAIDDVWGRLRSWLLGDSSIAPRVKLDTTGESPYRMLNEALGLGPGGSGTVPGWAAFGTRGGANGPGGPSRSRPITGNEYARYQQYYDYLTKTEGLTPEQATGMIAGGIRPESSGNPGAYNPNDAGSPSGGLFQWHAGRLTSMTGALGPSWSANWQGQLHYAVQEMKRIDPDYFNPGGTAAAKASEWTSRFEVPRNTAAQAALRASGAPSLFERFTRAVSSVLSTPANADALLRRHSPALVGATGVLWNSRGEAYSDTLGRMSADEKAHQAAAYSSIKESLRTRKPWYGDSPTAKPYWPPEYGPPPAGVNLHVVHPSGVTVNVEHSTGGVAPIIANQTGR